MIERRIWKIVGLAVGLAWGSTTHSDAATNSWSSFGPDAASLHSVAVDSGNPNVVYAAGGVQPAGVFRSIDAGATWTRAALPGGFQYAVAAAPSAPGTAYVGGSSAVYKTTDSGVTWLTQTTGVPSASISRPAIDPTNPNIVYAPTNVGVLKTVDGGATWVASNTGLTNLNVQIVAIDPANPVIVWLAATTGIFRSSNGGTSWSPTAGTFSSGASSLVIHPTNGTAYAVYVDGVDSRLHASSDSGTSWPVVSTQPLNNLYLVPGNPSRMYSLFGDQLLLSTNAGSTWSTYASITNSVANPQDLAFTPGSPSVMYVAAAFGAPGGVWKSTDGGATWALGAVGLRGNRTNQGSMAIVPGAPSTAIVAGQHRAVMRTTTFGTPWSVIPLAPWVAFVTAVTTTPAAPFTALAAITYGGVSRSTDGGATWLAASGAPSSATDVAIDPNNPAIVYAAGFPTPLSRSVDGGATFAPWGSGLPTSAYGIRIDSLNPQVIWALASSTVYRSIDGGVTWLPRNAGLPSSCQALAIDGSDHSRLYVGTSSGIYRTIDAGATWSAVYPGGLWLGLAAHPTASVVYAGSFGAGVYRSVDGGSTWQQINAGIDTPGAYTNRGLYIDPTNPSRVFADSDAGYYVIDVVPCTSAAQCDDSVACTIDTCAPASPASGLDGCVHTVAPAGTVCRAAAGTCDVVETCDGAGTTCPADAKSTAVCRPAVGPCDLADSCDGLAAGCPADATKPDDDLDGVCNEIDPCTLGAAVLKPKLTITKLLVPSGNEGFVLKGVMTVPTSPTIDPVAKGVRVVIASASGTTLFDETVPGGAYDPVAGIGWRVNGTGTAWKFVDKGGFTITEKVVLTGTTSAPGLYKFKVKSRRTTLLVTPSDLPLKATITIDAPVATSGQCGELTFPGAPNTTCAITPSGNAVRCK